MPSINAALGLAQCEHIDLMLAEKRRLARAYVSFFQPEEVTWVSGPASAVPNYWLNAALFPSEVQRDNFLRETNQRGVHTRAPWPLLHRLPMFASEHHGDLEQAESIETRLVTLPSSICYEK